MPLATAAVLRRLAESDNVWTAIISGRSVADLQSRVGLDVIYAGDHGLRIEGRGISFQHPGAERFRAVLDAACGRIVPLFQTIPGVVVERKEFTATVHYRQAPALLGDWIAATVQLATAGDRESLILRRARKAWELRPRLKWNKGSVLRFLLAEMGRAGAVVCAGDDATDEDMFDAVPGTISISVGTRRQTKARFRLRGPAELCRFLEQLDTGDMRSLRARSIGERSICEIVQ